MNETRPISVPEDMAAAAAARRRSVRRSLRRLVLLIVIPLIVIAIAVTGWLQTGGVSSTDDAYVRADKIAIVPRVSGRIVEVNVTENQPVKAGQLLFRIDPEPYKLAVQRSAAEVSAARLDIDSLKAAYRARLSQLKAARDSEDYWTKEFQRQHALVNNHDVSVSKYEQVHNFMDMARFMADAMEQQSNQTLQALGGNADIPTDQHPKVKAAVAAHDRALLELSYTDVTAPTDAYVSRENLQPGAWAQAGMPLFDLFASDDVRVEANFKETDLTDVRAGQPVTVTVDTYPDHVFHGHVASIAAATGAEFALLPAQNASGNWVKVVQRIPVRIAIDQQPGDPELRAGMSASVDITTGGKHQLADLLPSFLSTAVAKEPGH
jgi:membrane fusion protein (multidrug efflux system)